MAERGTAVRGARIRGGVWTRGAARGSRDRCVGPRARTEAARPERAIGRQVCETARQVYETALKAAEQGASTMSIMLRLSPLAAHRRRRERRFMHLIEAKPLPLGYEGHRLAT